MPKGCISWAFLLLFYDYSDYNNVAVTGKAGFTTVGRPEYYGE